MNLNEQLRQAYNAGRRQGLNEYIDITPGQRPEEFMGPAWMVLDRDPDFVGPTRGPDDGGYINYYKTPYQIEPGSGIRFPTGPYYDENLGIMVDNMQDLNQFLRYVMQQITSGAGAPDESEWPIDEEWWGRFVNYWNETPHLGGRYGPLFGD